MFSLTKVKPAPVFSDPLPAAKLKQSFRRSEFPFESDDGEPAVVKFLKATHQVAIDY